MAAPTLIETPARTVTLTRVDPAQAAGPQVFAQIKGAILRMDLAPGQPLSETDLGASLGVSRTPVREALADLRAIGLVATYPSRGSFVTKLNATRIREAQFLREGLELANIRRLAETGLPATQDTALSDNLEAQQAAVTRKQRSVFNAQDDAFHLLLADATGFPRAATVLSREKAVLDRLRVLSLSDDAHLSRLLDEHTALLAALRHRDRLAAEAALTPHLRSVLTVLHDLATHHADFFDTDPQDPHG